jgi:hypothetical protein
MHQQSPLSWPIEYYKLSLVKLLLANGADPDFSTTISGEALLNDAVRRWDLKLLKVLVSKFGYLLSTKALGLAITQRDSTFIDVFLSNHIKCDLRGL